MLECGQSNQQMKRTITDSLSFFNCFSRLSRHCTQKRREQEDVARPSSGLHDTYAEKHSFSKPDLIIATWEVQKKTSAWISVSCLNLLSTQHIKRKTALQNHLAEFDGEGSRLRFEQEHGQTDGWNGQKFSSDDNAAGIASLVPGVKNLRLRNCVPIARTCHFFSPSVWPSPRSNFDPGPSPSDSTAKIYQVRAHVFGVQFPLTLCQPCSEKQGGRGTLCPSPLQKPFYPSQNPFK